MTVLRKVAALIALLAAAALLFVVVCPVTPTPTAVVTSRHSAPVTVVTVALAVVLPSLVLVTSTFFQLQSSVESRETFAPLTVLNRTCVCLC